MNARFAEATVLGKNKCNIQIVLEPKTDEERMLLKRFVAFNNRRKYRFCIHGHSTNSESSGCTHMNFGFILKKKAGRKP